MLIFSVFSRIKQSSDDVQRLDTMSWRLWDGGKAKMPTTFESRNQLSLPPNTQPEIHDQRSEKFGRAISRTSVDEDKNPQKLVIGIDFGTKYSGM
jgi:hypothetical protein